MNISENLTALFAQLAKIFTTETVVGNPIKVENITLIPVISISFGAANGLDSDKDKGYNNQRCGAGAGGKITPNAIIVIKDGEVSVLPLANRGVLDKVIEMVPEIVSQVSSQTKE